MSDEHHSLKSIAWTLNLTLDYPGYPFKSLSTKELNSSVNSPEKYFWRLPTPKNYANLTEWFDACFCSPRTIKLLFLLVITYGLIFNP